MKFYLYLAIFILLQNTNSLKNKLKGSTNVQLANTNTVTKTNTDTNANNNNNNNNNKANSSNTDNRKTIQNTNNDQNTAIQLFGFIPNTQPLLHTPQYQLVSRLPRYLSSPLFVQGFKFLDESTNTIVESTGLYGQSQIHTLHLDTQHIDHVYHLDNTLFGEGCDWIINSNTHQKEVHQLTYKERQILVYDQQLNPLRTHQMPQQMKQGWGLKRFVDQKGQYYFYSTDGSDQIFIIDPVHWQVISVQKVVDIDNQPIHLLNEIELIDGYLYINLYLSYSIAKINPFNNFVAEEILDFTLLVDEIKSMPYYKANNMNYGDCLNGIAHNNLTKKTYLTGKKWPMIYEVKLLV